MGRALLIVIAIGLAVGAFLPMDDRAPRETDAPEAIAEDASADPGGRWGTGQGRETRLVRAANGHFLTEARVNGQPVTFVVDTGSTTVALTVADARRAGIPVEPTRFTVIGTGAGGPIRGQQMKIGRIDLNGTEVSDVGGAVIEGLEVSLLGQTYLSRFGSVTINGDTMELR